MERQRVIAISVLDLSEGRSSSNILMTSAHRGYARTAAAKIIPNLTVLTRSNDPVVNETVALILARAARTGVRNRSPTPSNNSW